MFTKVTNAADNPRIRADALADDARVSRNGWRFWAEHTSTGIRIFESNVARAHSGKAKVEQFCEEIFMKSVLAEAGRAMAGMRVLFDHTEGRAVSGLAKKGLAVRLDGEVRLTDIGAAWLATATV
ncbi:hypothetical protein WL39_20550 [Burkholderia ubonensis]|nr:hypothetical protein WL39_20550 [Burkholderia ubonensis]